MSASRNKPTSIFLKNNRNWSNYFFCLHQWYWTNTKLNNLQSPLVETDTESLESFSFGKSLMITMFLECGIMSLKTIKLLKTIPTQSSLRARAQYFILFTSPYSACFCLFCHLQSFECFMYPHLDSLPKILLFRTHSL